MKKFLIIFGVTLTISVLVGLWLVGWFLSKPVNVEVGDCPKELICQDVEFESESKSKIKGWVINGEAGNGVVILMHGVRANRSWMIERIKFLNNAGFSVLSFDFQSHGESIGEQITFGYEERLDSNAAIKLAKSKYPNEKIGVIGISMGGAAFLLSEDKSNADALILEMVYGTMEKAVENRLNMWLFKGAEVFEPILTIQFKPRLGVSIDGLRPIDKIHELKIPQLFIVGEKDIHTTLEESKELLKKANQPKEMWIVPKGEHQDLHKFRKQEYETKVIDFFEKHLDNR